MMKTVAAKNEWCAIAYGLLFLLALWRSIVHCSNQRSSKRMFHWLASGFSICRALSAFISLFYRGNPGLGLVLNELGTWLFSLQFFVITLRWANSAYNGNSRKEHTLRFGVASMCVGTSIAAFVLLILSVVFVPFSSDKGTPQVNASSAPTRNSSLLCEYKYKTSVGLSAEILAAVSAILLCICLVYYAQKLRFKLRRLSTRSHLMRLGLRQSSTDTISRQHSIDDDAKNLMFRVSEHRRQLVGNAGCVIYAYGITCTILLFMRASALIFLVVNPVCCDSLEGSEGCFKLMEHISLFAIFAELVPEIVPTLLMLHLMWHPVNGIRSVNFKSMRLRSIVHENSTASASPNLKSMEAPSLGMLTESLLQEKQQEGHHVIRSDPRECYLLDGTSNQNHDYLGPSTIRIPSAYSLQPLCGAVDFQIHKEKFISKECVACWPPQNESESSQDIVSGTGISIKTFSRKELSLEDKFCSSPLLHRAYLYSQPTHASLGSTPLLIVEQLREHACAFAVPHQLLRLLLRDQRHRLQLIRTSIRNFAKDSLQIFSSAKSVGLTTVPNGSGALNASRRLPMGDVYENALAMIEEDVEERHLTQWLLQLEREIEEYVLSVETAMKDLQDATRKGAFAVKKRSSMNRSSMNHRLNNRVLNPDDGQKFTARLNTTKLDDTKDDLRSHLLPENSAPPRYEAGKQMLSFKPSAAKSLHELRFVPTNLHSQDFFVAPASSSIPDESKTSNSTRSTAHRALPHAYSTITCGAPAAHCYGFKDKKGIRQLRADLQGHRQSLQKGHWSNLYSTQEFAGVFASEEGKLENRTYSQNSDSRELAQLHASKLIELHELEWEIKKRLDVAFSQATAVLTSAFCSQMDNVLACDDDESAAMIISQWYEIGFLAGFESLLSSSGSESGMLGDASAAIADLKQIEVFLITHFDDGSESEGNSDAEKGDKERFGRVAYESGFRITSGSKSLMHTKFKQNQLDSSGTSKSQIKGLLDDSDSDSDEAQPQEGTTRRSLEGLRGLSHGAHSADISTNATGKIVINITLQFPSSTPKIIREVFDRYSGDAIGITPVLFTQGVNEHQTAANYSMGLIGNIQLQREINLEGIQQLTAYFRSYDAFVASNPPGSNGGHGSCSKRTVAPWYTTEELRQQLHALTSSIQEAKKSVKNVEILLLAQVICRGLNAGRITMCKSGKDRTAMSVTLEQARLLLARHSVIPEAQEVLTDTFRSEGVRRDCVMKNVGSTFYAFNRLQRALLPKVLQSPESTCGAGES